MTKSKAAERREWKTPTLRMVAPARRTRGGGGDINDQDDIFYTSS